ncbi:MAG: radical SAM protein [DPANN group archaeon]|nr:radical SAM protein [DPANN group archaeon]
MFEDLLLWEGLEDNVNFVFNRCTGRWLIVDDEAKNAIINYDKLSERRGIDELLEKYKFLEKLEKKRTSGSLLVVFHMTQNCNYKCVYCYAGAGKGASLDIKNALQMVDVLGTQTKFKKSEIEFHGGEPLLEFEKIKQVIEYAKKYDNIKFSMQTNGSLLDMEKLEYLTQNKVGIGVSIDGPAMIHDKQRVAHDGAGTFEKTNNVLNSFEDKKRKVGIITVCTTNTIEHKEDYFNFLVGNGIKSFSINPMFPMRRGSENNQLVPINEQLLEMTKFMIEKVKSNNKTVKHKIRFRNIDEIISKIVNPDYYYRCLESPCGAGRDMVGLGEDGNVYMCEELVGIEKFKIRNNNYDLDKILENGTKRAADCASRNIKKCQECAFINYCPGTCLGKRYAQTGSEKEASTLCEFYKQLIKICLLGIYKEGWTNGYLVDESDGQMAGN